MRKPVLFRVTNNLNIGGVQRRIRSVLPLLTDTFDVHVVTYKDKGIFWEELPHHGVQTHFVPLKGKWDMGGIRRMAALFRQCGADIVHTHSLGGNISGILAASLAKVPVRIGQVHHRGVHWYARSPLHRWKQKAEETLIHRLFTDKVLHVSQESLDYFAQQTGLPSGKLAVLHNGVDFNAMLPDTDPAALRASLGIARHKTIIGFVGRLVEGKGVEFCMEFAKQCLAASDRYAFVIVGGAPEEKLRSLRKAASGWGDGASVVFTGERKDVANFYNLFDLYFFPSDAEWEGMPGVVLEACSFGLPVLARETAPVREISAYYPRILFMDDNTAPPAALEAALRLPAADQQAFRDRFSIEAMAERTRALYLALLHNRAQAHPAR